MDLEAGKTSKAAPSASRKPSGVRGNLVLDGIHAGDKRIENKPKRAKMSAPSFPTTPTSEAGLLSPTSPIAPRFSARPSMLWFLRRGVTLLLCFGGFCLFLYLIFGHHGATSTLTSTSTIEAAAKEEQRVQNAGAAASPLTEKEPTDPLERARWWQRDKPKKRIAIVMVAAGETYDGLYNASVYSHTTYPLFVSLLFHDKIFPSTTGH